MEFGIFSNGFRPHTTASQTYEEDLAEIVLADLELDGDLTPDVAHVVAGRRGLLFVFALGERAPWRLLATRPCTAPRLPFGHPGPPVAGAELQRLLNEAGLAVRIRRVAWSSRGAPTAASGWRVVPDECGPGCAAPQRRSRGDRRRGQRRVVSRRRRRHTR